MQMQWRWTGLGDICWVLYRSPPYPIRRVLTEWIPVEHSVSVKTPQSVTRTEPILKMFSAQVSASRSELSCWRSWSRCWSLKGGRELARRWHSRRTQQAAMPKSCLPSGIRKIVSRRVSSGASTGPGPKPHRAWRSNRSSKNTWNIPTSSLRHSLHLLLVLNAAPETRKVRSRENAACCRPLEQLSQGFGVRVCACVSSFSRLGRAAPLREGPTPLGRWRRIWLVENWDEEHRPEPPPV